VLCDRFRSCTRKSNCGTMVRLSMENKGTENRVQPLLIGEASPVLRQLAFQARVVGKL
jgi:hypothetical protein